METRKGRFDLAGMSLPRTKSARLGKEAAMLHFAQPPPRYLPRQHSLTMHRKGCCEPCATELPDDVKDAGIIGGLANRTAEIRSVELPVDAGCRLDLVQKC